MSTLRLHPVRRLPSNSAPMATDDLRSAGPSARLLERSSIGSPRRSAIPRPAPTASQLEMALREVVRGVIREEARSALADHRAEEREREATKLVPLADAAARLGLSQKALRSRCGRGSVPGAVRIGRRWHVALRGAQDR